ncbi:MAG: 4'-phosphopantetheinyl transferase family protein, partial [Crocinitomicaceae bacterium]
MTSNAISKHPTQKRTLEKNGVWQLVKNMFEGNNEVLYEPSGRPYLYGDAQNNFISISHSNNFVALASSYKRIGIDIEEINERILKVRSRFLNDRELEMINATDLEFNTIAWCMKEVLFKLSKNEGLDFKIDLLILEEIEPRKKFKCSMKEENEMKGVLIEI